MADFDEEDLMYASEGEVDYLVSEEEDSGDEAAYVSEDKIPTIARQRTALELLIRDFSLAEIPLQKAEIGARISELFLSDEYQPSENFEVERRLFELMKAEGELMPNLSIAMFFIARCGIDAAKFPRNVVEKLLTWAIDVGNVRAIEEILRTQSDDDFKIFVLRTAISQKHIAFYQKLPPSCRLGQDLIDIETWNMMYDAVTNGDFEAFGLAYYLYRGSFARHIKDGHNLLYYIGEFGRIEIAQYLFRRHPDLWDYTYEKGNTILHQAVILGQKKFVHFLLRERSDLASRRNREGETALLLAVCNRNKEIAEIILRYDEGRKTLDMYDNGGKSPLFQAVTYNSQYIIKLLIEYGADPNASLDDRSRTALHILFNHFLNQYHIQTYIKLGARNLADVEGKTPLDVLASVPYDVFRNLEGETASLLPTLIDSANSDVVLGKTGAYLSHWAAKNGSTYVLELLHLRGNTLNSPDKCGDRPIHYAAFVGNMKVFHYLAGLNIPFDVKNLFGVTPLAYAVAGGHMSFVKALYEKGVRLSPECATWIRRYKPTSSPLSKEQEIALAMVPDLMEDRYCGAGAAASVLVEDFVPVQTPGPHIVVLNRTDAALKPEADGSHVHNLKEQRSQVLDSQSQGGSYPA